jgi:hypothetical protein
MTTPGVNVSVTTEVGYCPFCQRTRNLRREERHLGGLVRIIVACESCNRTLSNTMGVPSTVPVEEPEAPAPAPAPAPEPEPEPVRAAADAKSRKPAAAARVKAATVAKKPAAARKAPAKK